MKKQMIALLLCCMVLGGCGNDGQYNENKTPNNNKEMIESGQTELEEGQEILSESYSIDGFENASMEYDRFNSYASENGLDGTLVYIEGKVLNQTQSQNVVSIVVEQEDGNKWVASIMSDTEIKELDDKNVRVFGTYLGFSDVLNVPAMGVVAEDFDYMRKCRIEIKNNREYETVWNFYEDYIEKELNKEKDSYNQADAHESNDIDTEKSQQDPTKTYTPTTGEKNALKSAKDYLSFTAFSYEGLIAQLEYENYSNEEAIYAANNCGVDWNEQALKSAKNYLSFSPFSYTGLIQQLEYEKFTTEQATYGADNCGADWNEQAVKSAENYLNIMSFSKDELIEQLKFEGFTHEQSVYGAEQNGY